MNAKRREEREKERERPHMKTYEEEQRPRERKGKDGERKNYARTRLVHKQSYEQREKEG